MGKSKPRNRTNSRVDPISKPVKPLTDPELVVLRSTRILPVINNLASADVKKRTEAALAIANLVEDKSCRKLLLREQIVRILLEQTITDLSLESKSAGWGILRNLAQEEEADFCIHLYRQDILTPLVGMIQLLVETLESQSHPITKLPKLQLQLVWSLCGSITGLVSSLAGAQEEALDALTKCQSLLPLLFAILKQGSAPTEQVSDVLACLTTLTEDNKALSQGVVQRTDWLDGLMQLRDDRREAMGAMVCLVLHNIFDALQWFDHNTPVANASDASLIPHLLRYLGTCPGRSQIDGDSYSPTPEVITTALAVLASIATTLQNALLHEAKHEREFEGFGDDEAETNGGMEIDAMEEDTDNNDASEDADDGEDEDEDEDEDDEMTQEQMEVDMALVAGTDGNLDEDNDEQEPSTLKLLIQDAIPKILHFASPLDGCDEQDIEIRRGALSALNNVAWTVSSIDTTISSISKSWSTRAQQIWTEVVSSLLTSRAPVSAFAPLVTSLAWALLRSPFSELQIQDDEARKFMRLYQLSESAREAEEALPDPFQSLGVKSIGVLGRLALRPSSNSLNREIGVFLITTLSHLPNVPVVDCVEALNQIYDIYADEASEYDEAVFWKDGFLRQLESIRPKFKSAVKTVDKRKDPEVRMRADEAALNLDRFLAYKRRTRKGGRAN